MPALPGAGVPARVAVPSPLSVKVTPLGSVVLSSLREGVGSLLVVTVKEPFVPMVNVVAAVLVTEGAIGKRGVMTTSAGVSPAVATRTSVAELSTKLAPAPPPPPPPSR